MIAAMPRFDDSGMLVWTRKLTLAVVLAATVVGAAGFVLADRESAVNVGTGAAMMVLFAVGNRIMTLRTQRWARVDESITAPVRVRRGRVVIRRWDAAALIMLPICTGLVVVAAAVAASMQPTIGTVLVLGLSVTLLVMMALLTFAERVVVTGQDVTIHRLVRWYVIPRHLVHRLRRTGAGGVAVVLEDGSEVVASTGVHSIWVKGGWNYRPAELKALSRIRVALEAIVAEPPSGFAVTVGHRLVVTTVWAVSALPWLASFVLIVFGWVPSS